MKKLVFAAIAAMVLVSVSNVFASNKMNGVSIAAPVDSVAPAAPADTAVAKDTAATKSACSHVEGANQQAEQESQDVLQQNPDEAQLSLSAE